MSILVHMEGEMMNYDTCLNPPITKSEPGSRRQNIKTRGYLFNPYSAGIDFRRQNLTSVDVRLRRLKSITAL